VWLNALDVIAFINFGRSVKKEIKTPWIDEFYFMMMMPRKFLQRFIMVMIIIYRRAYQTGIRMNISREMQNRNKII
jgi:hypothetical protein